MKKVIVASFLVWPLIILGLVLWHHSKKSNVSSIESAISRDKAASTVSSNNWGRHVIRLASDRKSGNLIEEALQIDTQDSPEAGLITQLKSDIAQLVEAYGDGSFEALKNFYISPDSLVDSNALVKMGSYVKDHPLEQLKISNPIPGHQWSASNDNIVLVPFDSNMESQLREGYRSSLAILLGGELAMRSYYNLASNKTAFAHMSRKEYGDAINTSVSEARLSIYNSTNILEYTEPWEDLSLDLLRVRVFSGSNVVSVLTSLRKNAGLLEAPQASKVIWCRYSLTPEQIIQKYGHVWYAVFQTAVRPRHLSFYGPVTIYFYYNPVENRWRVCQFICHVKISPSVPL